MKIVQKIGTAAPSENRRCKGCDSPRKARARQLSRSLRGSHGKSSARAAARSGRNDASAVLPGFLPEAEYQIRAETAGLTPFDVVQDPAHFNLEAALAAAWRVGDAAVPIADLASGLDHDEAGVRYWSAVALQVRGPEARTARDSLLESLRDESPSVRIAAAEALAAMGELQPALETLAEVLQDDRPWVALKAARALALIGAPARPLIPVMKQVLDKNRSAPASRRPYKDFNYASFTGWALETALAACGETVDVQE